MKALWSQAQQGLTTHVPPSPGKDREAQIYAPMDKSIVSSYYAHLRGERIA